LSSKKGAAETSGDRQLGSGCAHQAVTKDRTSRIRSGLGLWIDLPQWHKREGSGGWYLATVDLNTPPTVWRVCAKTRRGGLRSNRRLLQHTHTADHRSDGDSRDRGGRRDHAIPEQRPSGRNIHDLAEGVEGAREGGPHLQFKKSLYGLKQAGNAWYERFSNDLRERRFVKVHTESCMYRGKMLDHQSTTTTREIIGSRLDVERAKAM